MRIAAIDQGTTSTRVMVVEADGTATIPLAIRHAQHRPHPGWVEHDPEEVLASVVACVAAAGAVDAYGLDNQGESCLAWDALTGEALSPIIVWQDGRTGAITDALRRAGHEAESLAGSGLPLDPYFSASKLAWLLENVPAVQGAATRGRLRLGTTDAFLLQRLTGRCCTDVTTASRTGLMNLADLRWDPGLCGLFGVPLESLPEIVPSVGDFGHIEGVLLTAALVDQQAALYGHGCRRPSDAKVTFGTGAFALAVTGARIVQGADRGLLPTVAWQVGTAAAVRAVDGGVYDAGAAVDWAARLGLISERGALQSFDTPPAVARGLQFVPALSGLACPHWDRSAAAMWIGMRSDTTRQDLCQALLEGIALRTAEVVDTLDGEVPLGDTLSIDGGLAANPYFAQFLADVTRRSIVARGLGELTAAGTAELAALGLGTTLPVVGQDDRHYRPGACDAAAWRDRFATAVAKTKGWRVS